MNYEIDSIQHDPTNTTTPLHVCLVVYVGESHDETGIEIELDVSAKNLRTFETFREVVADELGWWLDDCAGRDNWERLVKDAFSSSRRWEQSRAFFAAQKRANAEPTALELARAACAKGRADV